MTTKGNGLDELIEHALLHPNKTFVARERVAQTLAPETDEALLPSTVLPAQHLQKVLGSQFPIDESSDRVKLEQVNSSQLFAAIHEAASKQNATDFAEYLYHLQVCPHEPSLSWFSLRVKLHLVQQVLRQSGSVKERVPTVTKITAATREKAYEDNPAQWVHSHTSADGKVYVATASKTRWEIKTLQSNDDRASVWQWLNNGVPITCAFMADGASTPPVGEVAASCAEDMFHCAALLGLLNNTANIRPLIYAADMEVAQRGATRTTLTVLHRIRREDGNSLNRIYKIGNSACVILGKAEQVLYRSDAYRAEGGVTAEYDFLGNGELEWTLRENACLSDEGGVAYLLTDGAWWPRNLAIPQTAMPEMRVLEQVIVNDGLGNVLEKRIADTGVALASSQSKRPIDDASIIRLA